ncbi:MAG: hypothetical protein JSW47_14280 [Phycisphaerales bacterium]|nr:MAG: hypothetical protein JSW47_14280 [Phycisphaerales bacterium]
MKPERASGPGKYIGWIILAAYSLLLVYRALRFGEGDAITNESLWELPDSRQLLGWILKLALMSFREFAYFVPLGFVATLVVPRRSRWLDHFAISLPALAVASMLAVLVRAIEIGQSWHLAVAVGLVLALLGCLFGTWMGTAWLRGWRARLWFLPKVALLAFLAVLCTGIILRLLVVETPLPFEAARVTSAEKRRLVRLIRSKSPRSLNEGHTHTLRLTEHDINVLLSWGLSLGSPNQKAKVSLARDSTSLSVSAGVTLGGRKTRYLNIVVAGGPHIHEGNLSLNVDRCRVGSVEVPLWLLDSLSPVITSRLSHDQRSKPFLDAIRRATIGPDSIEVTYGRLHLPPGFREDLFGPANASEVVLASTRAQVDHLLAVVSQLPNTRPSFGMCFETVFSLARVRSAVNDPVAENRAGIFALGVLLGHPRIEEFLGPVLPESDNGAARRALGRVVLRERADWTKHFCVSAAIALLSDELVSDAAGLLKEELDADIGGSGFSFADLLADRAGTTFAVRATRDEAAARAIQDRIVRGFRVEEFFPPAADLPERIPDAELQSRYDGVGGEAYRRLIEEIERRIAVCAAYR